jgi:dTDP-4-amino-4,6-dideoxygalactose transaminase
MPAHLLRKKLPGSSPSDAADGSAPNGMDDSEGNPIRRPDEFLVFGAPLIGEDERREVLDCFETSWLGTGPKVAQFEREFRAYKQAQYAVAVNSCTAALHLSLLAAGVGPGDEVITTALTFCATINAIIHTGARPVLADVDPKSFNIDPVQVAACITPKTKAIVPVHFAGRPCAIEALCAMARRHGLVLIEDCAHAIETLYKGRHAGTFGEFGCFSFYVTKNLVTGEGGMVLTQREADADHIKVLALHGLSKDAWGRFGDEGYKHYYVVDCGFKYNMMDIQAALGIHQLRRIETNWERRQQIWTEYQEAFRDLPLVLPEPPEPDTRHAYHLYTVLVEGTKAGIARDQFLESMTAENIGVGVHYQSIPTHPYYQDRFGWNPKMYPNSDRIGQQTVSLPLSPKLTDEDVADVIAAVRKVLRRHCRAAE